MRRERPPARAATTAGASPRSPPGGRGRKPVHPRRQARVPGESGLVTQGFPPKPSCAQPAFCTPPREERAWPGTLSKEPSTCTKEAPLARSGLRAACGRHAVNTITLENSLGGCPRETSMMPMKKPGAGSVSQCGGRALSSGVSTR